MATNRPAMSAWMTRVLLALRLPAELADHILIHAGLIFDPNATLTQALTTVIPAIRQFLHPTGTPPPNGACPIMQLPQELRQVVFAKELSAKDTLYEPHCCEDHQGSHCPQSEQAQGDSTPPPAKHNRASDLMTLSKTISKEVATVVYEERHYHIHVHEGIKRGGVEILNAGRQQIQYEDDVMEDMRFAKFRHGEEFGFDRLKKIKITIFPPANNEPDFKHQQVNTFFMNWSLCQLLQRNEADGKNKITKIVIDFAPPEEVHAGDVVGRRAIARAENYLWDPRFKKPIASSMHSMSNIEMVLRPFSTIRAHNVEINLPRKLRDHEPTKGFVARLTKRMLSAHGSVGEVNDEDFMDDKYAFQVRGMFQALQEQVLHELWGSGGDDKRRDIANLSDKDFSGDDGEENTKRDLSPTSSKKAGDWKRWKGKDELSSDTEMNDADEDEDEDVQRAIAASLDERRRSPGNRDLSRTPSWDDDDWQLAMTGQTQHQPRPSMFASSSGRRLGGGAPSTSSLRHGHPSTFVSLGRTWEGSSRATNISPRSDSTGDGYTLGSGSRPLIMCSGYYDDVPRTLQLSRNLGRLTTDGSSGSGEVARTGRSAENDGFKQWRKVQGRENDGA